MMKFIIHYAAIAVLFFMFIRGLRDELQNYKERKRK